MSLKLRQFGIGLVVLICGTLLFRHLRHNGQHDFTPFYLGGKLAASGRIARIYDPDVYKPLIAELRSQGERMSPFDANYFIRPAFEAFLYAPLASLPFRQASLVALLWNFGLLGILVWKLPLWFGIRSPARPLARLALAVFYPFLWSISVGQDTLLLTLLVAYALFLESTGRAGYAGFALGLCAWKPHLIWLLPLALLASGRRRMSAWFLATGSALLAFSFLAVGVTGLRQWGALAQSSSTDIHPLEMANIRALALNFGPVCATGATVLLIICFCVVMHYGSFHQRVSAALLTALLVSPHAYWQDCSLLAPVAMIATRRWIAVILLFPWPFLYPRADAVPMIFIVLFCMAVTGGTLLWERWPLRAHPLTGWSP